MFAIPGKTIIEPWMGERVSASFGKVIEGREIVPVDTPVQTERMVVGSEGVSIKFANGSHWTVRYANLVAALHYDDGALCLVSSDSTWLRIEPMLWRTGAKVCEEIRAKIPVHLILEQEPRDQNAIPKPRTTSWQRFRALLALNFMRLFGLGNRSAGPMGKSTKRNAYYFLGLRALIDIVVGAVLYRRFVDRGEDMLIFYSFGLIFFSFIFYLFLFIEIKKESIYGFAYSHNPTVYWIIFCFLVFIQLCLMLWVNIFSW